MAEPTTPAFEYVNDYNFTVDEDVYVIDGNGFDIWPGKVVSIEENKLKIHYPDYPDDDEEIALEDKRVLVKTTANTTIFTNQEEIRNRKVKRTKKAKTYTPKVPRRNPPKGSRRNPSRSKRQYYNYDDDDDE